MADAALFAVTTRSRLKGPWLFPAMWAATVRVRRQLADDPSVVRWASVVAGPTEFWTITVWKSRHDMQEFMRSGAHDEIMWLFAKLLRSFWLMRWKPSAQEFGHWRGLRLSGTAAREPSPLTAPAKGLEQALVHLPWLAAATGPDGRAAYEHTPFAIRRQQEVGGAAGMVANLGLPRRSALTAMVQSRRLRKAAVASGAARAVVGAARPGDLYVLALWTDGTGLASFLDSPEVRSAVHRWGDRLWLSSWAPENEFGHWDGLRVRRRRRPVIAMPAEAERLGN